MTPGLLVMDVDSTLITAEVIELLAERAGTRDAVAAVTEAAMRGEIDFAQSLIQRVATLEGVAATAIDDVIEEVQFSPDALELFEALHGEGWVTALVSGGFIEIVGTLGDRVGARYVRANGLEIVAGHLTGKTRGPIIDAAAKAAALAEFCADLGIDLSQAVAVGDGANDLAMMASAGLSIAYNAKPVVRDAADHVVDGSMLRIAHILRTERSQHTP